MKTMLKNCRVIRSSTSDPCWENIIIENDRIVDFTSEDTVAGCTVIDLQGKTVIPGFVQTHVHLCQVLFRGLADDLALFDWLKKRIWPLEAVHDWESTYYSALLGCMEMLAGGVTSACVMESVRYADAAAQAIADLGMRAVFGKAMMDYTDTPYQLGALPSPFMETTQQSIDSCLELIKRWHGAENRRISFAFMPRGILTTSKEMLEEIARLSKEYDTMIHTHACETRSESDEVIKRRGMNEIKYLHSLGLTNEKLLLAHCVWVDDDDIAILEKSQAGVSSCPIANLKLASGVAPLAKMATHHVRLSLGSDGAPCNNNLDMFQEMKYASLLQKGLVHDPTLMPAWEIFGIATQGGADVLNMGEICGSLAVGKKADLAVLDLDQRETSPAPQNIATIVYAGNARMVTDTMVDGIFVYRNRQIVPFDEYAVHCKAQELLSKLLERYEGEL